MQRRSLLTAAAGIVAGGYLKPSRAQIAPQAVVACESDFLGSTSVFNTAEITALEAEALRQSRALRERPTRFRTSSLG